MRFFVGIGVFFWGTVVTLIILSMTGNSPDSFYDIFVPWLFAGIAIMFLPKVVGKVAYILCGVALTGSLLATGVGLVINAVEYFQKERVSECSESSPCLPQVPDTSDLIDAETPSGDNNSFPGYHGVEGHYRDGQYIEPYIRSNPDGDPSNNLSN
jgi:hypothetical protein